MQRGSIMQPIGISGTNYEQGITHLGKTIDLSLAHDAPTSFPPLLLYDVRLALDFGPYLLLCRWPLA